MGGIQSSNKSKAKPKPKGGITPIDRATLDLKISRDRQAKYRTKLALDSDKLANRAKKLQAEGNTKNALQLMRLRKYKIQEADRVEEQLMTVLRMVDKISEKQNEQEVVQAMKLGKDALQIMHEEIEIDGVLDLMDDIRDQDEVEKRINEVLGQEGLTVMEDEDVLAELEQLEEEVRLEEEKQNAFGGIKGGDAVFPEAPEKPLPALVETIKQEPAQPKIAVAS